MGGAIIQALRAYLKIRERHWRGMLASLSIMFAVLGWPVASMYAAGWLREGARWAVLYAGALVGALLFWSLYRVNLHMLYGRSDVKQRQAAAAEDLQRVREEASARARE